MLGDNSCISYSKIRSWEGNCCLIFLNLKTELELRKSCHEKYHFVTADNLLAVQQIGKFFLKVVVFL